MGSQNIQNWTAERLASFVADAVSRVPSDVIAFLATGSKPEGPLRDQLAVHIHQTTGLIAAREYSDPRAPKGLGKRVDLAVLSKDGLEVLIETKAWTHFNALEVSKLRSDSPKDGVKGAFESDARKLMAYRTFVGGNRIRRPDAFVITFFFGVAVVDSEHPALGIVKYAAQHKRALKKFGGLESLCSQGLENARGLLSHYGETVVSHLAVGSSWGMEVQIDALVTHLEDDVLDIGVNS
jgi:hypothetical protein